MIFEQLRNEQLGDRIALRHTGQAFSPAQESLGNMQQTVRRAHHSGGAPIFQAEQRCFDEIRHTGGVNRIIQAAFGNLFDCGGNIAAFPPVHRMGRAGPERERQALCVAANGE